MGADHPDTATSLNNLAALYDAMGRYGEAEPLYGRALAIAEQQLGANHPLKVTIRNNFRQLQAQPSPLKPWQWILLVILLPIWLPILVLIGMVKKIKRLLQRNR